MSYEVNEIVFDIVGQTAIRFRGNQAHSGSCVVDGIVLRGWNRMEQNRTKQNRIE